MRWWIVVFGVVALRALGASAELVPFTEGRLTLQFGSLYGVAMPPAPDPGATGSLETTRAQDGSLASIQLPAGLFAGSVHVAFGSVGPPQMPIARGVDLTASNEAGTFVSGTGTAAAFGGTMPLAGIHRVCLFFACGDPDATNVTVPLGAIGQGGIVSDFEILRVAIAGGVWSTGAATVDLASGATSMITGGTTPTQLGGKRVRLVTPVMLSTNAVLPNDEDAPPVRGFGLVTFVLAPEPGETGLLAVAIVALVAIGHARSRRAGPTS